MLAIVAIAITTILIYGDDWAEGMLREKIEQVEALSYDSLDIQIADRKIKFNKLKYVHPSFNLDVDKVEINDIRLLPLLWSKKLKINNVLLDGASLKLLAKDSTIQNQKKGQDPDQIPKLDIALVKILNSSIDVPYAKNKSPSFNARLEIILKNIDKGSVLNPQQLVNKISSSDIKNIRFQTMDSLYRVTIKSLAFNAEKNFMKVDSVDVKCNYKKYQLGHVIGHEQDWIEFNMDSAHIETSGLEQLIFDKSIRSVVLHQPTLNVFRDKRLPFPEHRRPKILQEILADDSSTFSVDSIFIKNANIAYEEFVKQAVGPGRVSFNQLNGYISNLYTYNLKRGHPPHLVAKCDLFNSTKLYADISFPTSKNGKTWVKGKVEEMDMTTFNQMVQFVAFMKIKDGEMQSLDFDFSYDQTHSSGEMNFVYQDLKIDFVNKEDAQSKGLFNEIKGFIANTFVVDSKNNYDSGKFRVGKIDFERNMQKSMFNFWWNSLLTGFRSSTGVNASGEKIDVD